MREMLEDWGERLLDLLYPCRCSLCGVELSGGRALCGRCADALPRVAEPFCAKCGEGFPGGSGRDFECPHCADLRFTFKFARAAMSRDAQTLDLIHRLKYQRDLPLGRELGKLACEALADPRFEHAIREKWPLVPVPLHRRKHHKRQFNQAEEITRVIACESGLPLARLLRRIRDTGTQTRLKRSGRLKNLKGAFVIRRCPLPGGVILVDDVFTTGATVEECARVLHEAGVQEVLVLTVMRG